MQCTDIFIHWSYNVLLKAEINVFTLKPVGSHSLMLCMLMCMLMTETSCNDSSMKFSTALCSPSYLEACLSGCGMFWTLCLRVDFVLASNLSQRNTSLSRGKKQSWIMIYKEGPRVSSSLQSASFHPHSPVTPSDRGTHSQVSQSITLSV